MLGKFELFYPIIMSLVWIIGTMFYELLIKYQTNKNESVSVHEQEPTVDIFMSCYNEADVLETAVQSLESLDYENFSLILIDDHSSDDTLRIMRQLANDYSNIKIIVSDRNQGKAEELNKALSTSRADYILCVDADAIFDQQCLQLMVQFLENNQDCGAVTGRPLVKNTTTALGKLQYLEYFMNIDFIKRAEFLLTQRILTVSGVLTLFRRKALVDVAGWNPAAMTEDIDITWRLYRQKWACGYEPRALCHIFVPESILGFLKQRTRWARGGAEVFYNRIKYLHEMSWGEWLLTLDIMFSYGWLFLLSFSLIRFVFQYVFDHHLGLRLDIIILYFGLTLLFYLAARILNFRRLLINSSVRRFLLLPIYFYLYWSYNLVVTFIAFYHLFDRAQYAAWGDSDRGGVHGDG
ncbi:glycosyltransferase family 2 protein [Lactiplantibacillus plantarum]|uniref:glycosyltransferase family 2 protein n=1 Tax=Lactiplantibacillus plantarum TaxID=1590 RepID=UPI002FE5BF90